MLEVAAAKERNMPRLEHPRLNHPPAGVLHRTPRPRATWSLGRVVEVNRQKVEFVAKLHAQVRNLRKRRV